MNKKYFIMLLVPLACLFFNPSAMAASKEAQSIKVSKEPISYKPSINDAFVEFQTDHNMEACIEGCKYRNRMASIGIEAIMESCQYQCDLEKATRMAKSSDPKVKAEGISSLCEFADKSTVSDLIFLLKEDMVKRTGAWAEIIPALGVIRDSRAVPILVELVKNPDDDWLGRNMSVAALGEIGDHSATKVLMGAAWKAETRDAAIIALAKLNDTRAASTLVSAIQPDEELFTREAATNGLVSLGSNAVDSIHAEYKNYSPENKQTKKRVWLCEILGKINDAESHNILQKSLHDNDIGVRECAEKYKKTHP